MAEWASIEALCFAASSSLSPRSLACLGRVAPALRRALEPLAERRAKMARLREALARLPVQFHFPLHGDASLLEDLDEALRHFATLKVLRWRQKAGQAAGWVPTEEEMWQVSSRGALRSLLTSSQSLLSLASPCRAESLAATAASGAASALLFAATLRRSEHGDSLAPLAFEWACGPAADPLQLALALHLGDHGPTLQVEMISGGWSEWSQTWSLEDGSLDLALGLAWDGDQGPIILHHRLGAKGIPEIAGHTERHLELAHGIRTIPQLSDGQKLSAVVCVSAIRWCAEAPPWRPREIRRIEV
ncbi:unnamed protein product [Durusdinium trenchii]|uniref:Chloroplastic n=2 Tax=Durusdinium trenchii TaxID=1381693 RepID=A0ABP0HQH2_9DINO